VPSSSPESAGTLMALILMTIISSSCRTVAVDMRVRARSRELTPERILASVLWYRA
jgi:hypothetical protein